MWLVGEADQGSVLGIEPDGHAVVYVDERPPYDEYAPAHLRGIGVGIEDDVVVITVDGDEVISSVLPTTSDGLDGWLAALAS